MTVYLWSKRVFIHRFVIDPGAALLLIPGRGIPRQGDRKDRTLLVDQLIIHVQFCGDVGPDQIIVCRPLCEVGVIWIIRQFTSIERKN